MTKNPFVNSLVAALYIISISIMMYFGTRSLPKEDTFLAPLAMISLFTFSAAAMAYIFFFQPFQLYFDGKKKEAIKLVYLTIMSFGAITLVFLILLFSGIF